MSNKIMKNKQRNRLASFLFGTHRKRNEDVNLDSNKIIKHSERSFGRKFFENLFKKRASSVPEKIKYTDKTKLSVVKI